MRAPVVPARLKAKFVFHDFFRAGPEETSGLETRFACFVPIVKGWSRSCLHASVRRLLGLRYSLQGSPELAVAQGLVPRFLDILSFLFRGVIISVEMFSCITL